MVIERGERDAFERSNRRLYLSLMWRWEKTAPPDGKKGLLDDKPESNTQISRMVYLLRKVASGVEQRTYNSFVVVATWGNYAIHLNRADEVRKLIPNLHSLKVNHSGEPAHPLYLRSEIVPEPYGSDKCQ